MTSHRELADAGFTLIETLVVVAVLGLALNLLVLRGPLRSQGMEASAAATELAESLRIARGRAIAANRPVTVLFDVAGRSFRVDGGQRRVLPAQMGMSVTALSGSPFGQVAGIVFAPDGSSSGGRVELQDGQHGFRIGVDWLTGRVSMANVH